MGRRRRRGRGVYKPKKQPIIKPGSRKEVADGLKLAAAFLLFRRGYAVAFELGISAWGSRRADVIGNKINGHMIMVEVKSSVEDFRKDYLRKSRTCSLDQLTHSGGSLRVPVLRTTINANE
jgi:hypothetical protein